MLVSLARNKLSFRSLVLFWSAFFLVGSSLVLSPFRGFQHLGCDEDKHQLKEDENSVREHWMGLGWNG